jgi:hypothetical protein
LDPSAVRSNGFEVVESSSHLLTESFGTVREILVDDDLESGFGDSASERVLSVCTSTLAFSTGKQMK